VREKGGRRIPRESFRGMTETQLLTGDELNQAVRRLALRCDKIDKKSEMKRERKRGGTSLILTRGGRWKKTRG